MEGLSPDILDVVRGFYNNANTHEELRDATFEGSEYLLQPTSAGKALASTIWDHWMRLSRSGTKK